MLATEKYENNYDYSGNYFSEPDGALLVSAGKLLANCLTFNLLKTVVLRWFSPLNPQTWGYVQDDTTVHGRTFFASSWLP